MARLANILSVACLMWVMAVVALWAVDRGVIVLRQSSSQDHTYCHRCSLNLLGNGLWFANEQISYDEPPEAPPQAEFTGWSCGLLYPTECSLPFGWSSNGAMHQGRLWMASFLFVPVWPVAALVLLLPLWRLIVHRQSIRRWARRSGKWLWPAASLDQLCVICGYDLHAAAGHCPECGTPVARSTQGHSLTHASPAWLRALRLGVIIALIAMFADTFCDWSCDCDLLGSRPVIHSYLVNSLHWLGILGGTAGLLLQTCQEPRLSMREPLWNRRLLIRLLIIVPHIVSISLEPRYVPLDSLWARTVDEVAVCLVQWPGYLLWDLLWISYARRIPAPWLTRVSWACMVWDILTTLFSLVTSTWSLASESLGATSPDFDWLYEPRHLFSDTLGLIVGIWWILTLTRLLQMTPLSSLSLADRRGAMSVGPRPGGETRGPGRG